MDNQETNAVSAYSADSLVEYCRTPRQREIIEMKAKGLSTRQIARELGCGKSTVNDTIQLVRGYATVKGVDPAHSCFHPCSDAYLVKGTSTLYDKNGTVSAQWVKTTIDQEKLAALQKSLAAEFAKTLPRYQPKAVSSKKQKAEKKLAVIPLADAHIGCLAWARETGADYDVEIAERDICTAVKSLIDSAPACEECILFGLGDWQHFDNAIGVTERSNNALDTDGRYAKMLGVAIRVMRYTIEYAAQKFPRVVFAHCKGNHDDLGALWLAAAMQNVYEKDKRIVVLDNVSPRIYYRWNSVLLMGTHGSDVKAKDLPLVMATERRQDWGDTKHHVVLCGHIHHKEVLREYGDCTVEAFDALCAKDAWSNEKGFMSKRTAQLLVFDPDDGEIMRLTHVIG